MKISFKKGLALTTAVMLACSMVLSGCGGGDKKPADAKKEAAPAKKQNIAIGTGGTGGTYALLGAGMAKILSDNVPGLSVTTEGTSASVENTRLVSSGDLAISLCSSDAFYTASIGAGSFKGKKIDNIRIIMGGYDAPFHVMVKEGTPYKTIADLKGKKVAASPGNTAENQLPIIMEAYGMKKEDYVKVPLQQGEQADALKNGSVDAIIQTTGVGASAFKDLTTTTDIRFLSFNDAEIKAINQKYPYMVRSTIPANTYRLQTKEIPTVTTVNFLVTRKEADPTLIYNITKALHTHNKDFAQIHPLGARFTPKFTIENPVVPLHDGAIKYYKEIGAMK